VWFTQHRLICCPILIDWFITRSDTINFDEQYSNRVQVRKSDATFQIKFFNCIDAETKPFF
jgi:hypothetical protein